jgi:predicted transcriptional regulator
MLITPEQIRAARALLRLDQARLAHDAGISLVTLRRLEAEDGLSKVAPTTVDEVRKVLENAGAEFIDRGVRHAATPPETLCLIKQDIDRIVAHSTALMAQYPYLTDDELYDETGI